MTDPGSIGKAAASQGSSGFGSWATGGLGILDSLVRLWASSRSADRAYTRADESLSYQENMGLLREDTSQKLDVLRTARQMRSIEVSKEDANASRKYSKDYTKAAVAEQRSEMKVALTEKRIELKNMLASYPRGTPKIRGF